MSKRENYLQWDEYFMATALLSAKRSKDPVTQVGACIVDNDNRIVAIGYNGLPRNCSDDEFPWGKDDNVYEDKSMYVVHAEANAILNKNSANINGARLYTTLYPCNECAKLIVQSGISEIIYISNSKANKPKYRASERILKAANIKCRKFNSTKQQVIINFSEENDDEKIDFNEEHILDIQNNLDNLKV